MTIQTFVFFAVEVTGKPAKIAEITLVAVSRDDIIQASGETNQSAAVAQLTLKGQKVFEDNINCINAFLDKPKPVCLLAPEQNNFKVLLAKYQNAKQTLPLHLLFIDSLKAFKHILVKNPEYGFISTEHDASASSLDGEREVKEEEHWYTAEDNIQVDFELADQFSQLASTSEGIKAEKGSKNETPKKGKTPRKTFTLFSVHEKLLINKTPVKEPNNQKLYSHRTEENCNRLFECVIATKQHFLIYADKHQKLISQIA